MEETAIRGLITELRTDMDAGFAAIKDQFVNLQKTLNGTNAQLDIPMINRLIDVQAKVTDLHQKMT